MEEIYRRNLVALQRIRTIAGCELKLPQICVVGDQSSGKSSLLSELTGIRFPQAAGMCTKAPIVVECKMNNDIEGTLYEIEEEDKYTKISESAEISLIISDAQSVHLNGVNGKFVTKKEVRLRITGNDQIDLIVIDLPGIINQGESKDEIEDLIREYISDEQTLIVLVSEAKQDDELAVAIELCKEYDPYQDRTIRVFTKCDSFDTKDTTERAVSRVNSYNEKLSPHAVICRFDGDDYDAELEIRTLKSKGFSSNRSGVSVLKERLVPLFAELIQTNLPNLQDAVVRIIKNTTSALDQIGHEPLASDAMLLDCTQVLQKSFVAMLEEPVSAHLKNFQEGIHGTEKKITHEWVFDKLHPNSFKCPFFQGTDALDLCMAEIITWWEPILSEYSQNVENLLASYIDILKHRAPVRLYKAIACEWKNACSVMCANLKKAVRVCLQKEADFGTMNHYLTSKFEAEEIMPEGLVDDIVDNIKREVATAFDEWYADKYGSTSSNEGSSILRSRQLTSVPAKVHAYTRTSSFKELLKEEICKAKDRWVIMFARKSLHEQQQYRLFDAIKAQWAVEHKTFIDCVLKETRETLMKPSLEWFTRLPSSEVKSAAVEDREQKDKRDDLKHQLERMHNCMHELKQMGSGVGLNIHNS